MFKYGKLSEVVRKSDQVFVKVLNSARLGTIDENTEKLLKIRFIDQSDKTYSCDTLRLDVENSLTVLRNQTVLNHLLGQVHSIEKFNGKVPDGLRYPFPVIQVVQN